MRAPEAHSQPQSSSLRALTHENNQLSQQRPRLREEYEEFVAVDPDNEFLLFLLRDVNAKLAEEALCPQDGELDAANTASYWWSNPRFEERNPLKLCPPANNKLLAADVQLSMHAPADVCETETI